MPAGLFSRALVLMVCLTLLAGCESSKETGLTFAVGGAPAEVAYWDSLIHEFQKESGIRVNLLRQPTDSDQRRQSLVIALDAGQSNPDVFLMDVVWISQFAASAWLQPLGDFVRKDAVNLGAFFPGVLKLADNYQGDLVALPVYVDGGLLYFRKDLLQKQGISRPPETWDELVKYSLAVQGEMRRTRSSFYGFLWQGAQYEGLICDFLEFAGSNRGGIIIRDGQIRLNTPENREALQFMQDLIQRYKISPPSTYTEMREEQVRLAFQRGDALFERNWPYAWALHQRPNSPVRGRTGIAPLPHFPSGKSISTLGGWHIGISRFSNEKPAAWAFVKYVVSHRIQKKLALDLGWNPGRRDVYDDPEVLKKMPHLARLGEVFENAAPRPTRPYYTEVSEVLQRYLNGALAGKLTPAAALEVAQKDAQAIVDRYEGR